MKLLHTLALRVSLGLGVAMAVATPVLTTGCNLFGELKEGMGHVVEVKKKIKSELGVDANVNFNITNGHKVVTVELSSTPKGDAKDIKDRVEKIVRAEFGAVDEIRVSL